jgi:alkaline phosphatase D
MDDHDVVNNYTGASGPGGDPAAFARRRAAAYQAWWEHLPLRSPARPRGARMNLARRLDFGDLAVLHLLDTRQRRTPAVCGGPLVQRCDDVFDPAATMLGPEQERWLGDGLARSRARWNLLAQQVVMTQLRVPGLTGDRYVMDSWDGYAGARRRLLQGLVSRRVSNPVVLSGDYHSTWVADLKLDFGDEAQPAVATELVGTSISSRPPGALEDATEILLAANPHVQYLDATRRGYLLLDITRDQLRVDVRTVHNARRPSSPVSTSASFVVESGRPGARRA